MKTLWKIAGLAALEAVTSHAIKNAKKKASGTGRKQKTRPKRKQK